MFTSLTKMRRLLVLLLVIISNANAFIWRVEEELKPLKTLTYSERFMFGTGRGPAILPNEHSNIEVHLQFDIYLSENRSSGFQYAVYLPDDNNRYTGIGLCNDDPFQYKWAVNIQNRLSFTKFKDEKMLPDGSFQYHYAGYVSHKYRVYDEGWHNIDIQTCVDEDIYVSSQLKGEVSFKNPYGYVPAEQWGIIPFETIRALVTTVLAVGYAALCLRHKESLLPLHKAVGVTLVVCAISAVLWSAAFIDINTSGHPYCCPFPPVVTAAQLVQVLRQALARLLLLIVSLGYGIVRPKLQRLEWALVTAITLFYFVAALSYEINDIVFLDVHPDSSSQPKSLLYPALLADLLFLGWIYLAMNSTIRILHEFQQTHKLEMYDQLWITIGVFVIQFLIVTLIMSMNRMGYIDWPWQWNWVQQVAWEMVNFSIIFGVAIICRPTDRSQLLSYASQLPMEDPDDDAEDYETGVEIVDRKKIGKLRDDSDEDDDDIYALPSANDDEEFGLDEL